jgi:hypothetical protein
MFLETFVKPSRFLRRASANISTVTAHRPTIS